MIDLSKHRMLFFFAVLTLLLSATFYVINFAKGYRIDFVKKTFVPNGILSINSNPVGADVFVDRKLKTATNNTLSLAPGNYDLQVKKSGFQPWSKRLTIEKEMVTFADAFLFPEIPDLKPLTFLGAQNPVISPDNANIIFSIPLPFPEAGLWLIDVTDSLLVFSKEPRQIAKSSLLLDFAKTNYAWTPDGRQVLVQTVDNVIYSLDPNQLNQTNLLVNVAGKLEEMKIKWQKDEDLRNVSRFKRIPEKLQTILKESAASITFSPDNTKIMYVATASAEIPEKLIPPVLSASTQTEARKIETNRLYVYDIKEDRNFFIPFKVPASPAGGQGGPSPTPTPKPLKSKNPTSTPSVQLLTSHFSLLTPSWFPTSRHLVWINPSAGSGQVKVVSCEYDGANLTTIYSGSFNSPYVFTTPNSSKIVILADIDFSIEKQATPTPSTKLRISPTPTPERPKTNLFSVSLR